MKYRIQLILFFFIIQCFACQEPQVTAFFSLCSEFWDLDKPVPSPELYSFYRHYAAKASGPILEPMCGAGRYMLPLFEEGFEVEGFDASPFMIDVLRNKCAKKNISPCAYQQFLEKMPTSKQYKLIFIPDTSFCFFTDLADVKRNLEKIYSLLQPGGTFVFDIQTIYSGWGTIGEWTQQSYEKANGDILVEHSLPLEIKDSLSPIELRYELIRDNKIIKTETEKYVARLYAPHQMDRLLKQVGFKKIKRIKAHDRNEAPSPQDEVIVYECIKN